MVADIFGVISQAITNFGQALGSACTSVVALFYTAPTGSETSGSFTFLGYLMLITAGIGIVYWAFYLIRSALHIGVK